jgi:acetyltransferase-like isoleucine patch superfamily enzyme
MSMGCYLDARNGIVLGNNVYIGPRVSIISMNHDVNNYTQYIKEDPIIIGDNCWIGTNAIILPGVELGNHVVVGAGAVVTKSFKDNNLIIAGNPASVIKKLPDYNE